MNTILPKDAVEEIKKDEVVVVDVRTREEYLDGHIHGAQNIDIYENSFAEKVKALDMHKTYIIYCQSGGRSSRATAFFQEMGFSKALNLEGGISAWKREGFEVEE